MTAYTQISQPLKLTIEEIKTLTGLENLSDEELDELAESIREYSLILYSAFQTQNE